MLICTVLATDDEDAFVVLEDGAVTVVGSSAVVRSPGEEVGYVVRQGGLSFGYEGDRRAERVLCEGRLWERRHAPGPALEPVVGQVAEIYFRPRAPGGSSAVFEKGTRIYNTAKLAPREDRPRSWALMFVLDTT